MRKLMLIVAILMCSISIGNCHSNNKEISENIYVDYDSDEIPELINL